MPVRIAEWEKTTVTLALLAAFSQKGCQVQPFKIGPDFIDPGHHKAACGQDSFNLDGWMLGTKMNRQSFTSAARDADISIIEGMMGLFDGSSPVNEIGSAAELAKQLNVPVLLVIDGSAMARSAAAMVHGYATFDSKLRIAGVLFNRVKSEGHFHLLKEAIEKETEVKAVGYLQPNPELTIPDRHLGLQTAIEGNHQDIYTRLGESIAETTDLDLIEQLARSACEITYENQDKKHGASATVKRVVKIAVAHDPAFCFYYPDNLELLEHEGAEVVTFSPINDRYLPKVELLYLGGGYPEVYACQLEKNIDMRRAIQHFARDGGAIYAECGGLMYLTSTLFDFEGRSYEMLNVIPATVKMDRAKMTLGYRSVDITQDCFIGKKGTIVRGHEFHYSSLISEESLPYHCDLTNSQGRQCGQDGVRIGNVLGFYTHLHFKSNPSIAQNLVHAVMAS